MAGGRHCATAEKTEREVVVIRTSEESRTIGGGAKAPRTSKKADAAREGARRACLGRAECLRGGGGDATT